LKDDEGGGTTIWHENGKADESKSEFGVMTPKFPEKRGLNKEAVERKEGKKRTAGGHTKKPKQTRKLLRHLREVAEEKTSKSQRIEMLSGKKAQTDCQKVRGGLIL